MGEAKAPGAVSGEPPGPEGVASLDELIERLRDLRVWAGVSYRGLHRPLVRRRRSRGVPEEPAYATVYRCFQPGHRRIDIDLVVEIAAELTDDIQADLEEAAGSNKSALALAVELGDPHAQAVAHEGLARISGDQNDRDLARRPAQESHRLFMALGTKYVDNVAMYLASFDEGSSRREDHE